MNTKALFLKTITLITSAAFALALCSCSSQKEAPSSGGSSAGVSSQESVELEYFTDDEGVIHKISDINFASPEYSVSWSELEGLPEDFPVLYEKITEYSNFAGNISIKWNIISPDDQAAIIEKLEDWASSQPEVKAESAGTTYKFVRDDPANGKRYSVDMLYQPYADGQRDEASGEWFAQLQIFLYSSNLATVMLIPIQKRIRIPTHQMTSRQTAPILPPKNNSGSPGKFTRNFISGYMF